MRKTSEHWKRHISYALLVVTLVACQRTQPLPLIDQTKNMKLLGEMTQRCVGRYTIELPEKFVLNSQGGQIIDGVTINVEATTPEAFESRLASRTAELERTLKLGPKQDYPMLRKVSDPSTPDCSGSRAAG